jgi:hypothetical protein
MSRTAHIGIGLVILVLCFLWCIFGLFMFFALAAGRDGGTIYDSAFIVLYLIFGAGFLAGLRSAFLGFRRALQSPQLDAQFEPGQAIVTRTQQDDIASSDEKLAHLMKGSEK